MRELVGGFSLPVLSVEHFAVATVTHTLAVNDVLIAPHAHAGTIRHFAAVRQEAPKPLKHLVIDLHHGSPVTLRRWA